MCDEFSRGSFVRGALAAAATISCLATTRGPVRANGVATNPYIVRELWLQNAITGQSVQSPFTIDGRSIYRPGYYAICDILRDTHVPASQGDVLIDIRTIEALYEVQQVLLLSGIREPIVVHSGYRTAGTNEAVGGAPASYHMRAQAVDFSVPGVSMEYVLDVCNSRKISGGLGYYPGSHIHIDCGPRRYWTD